jgi:hypothetical protein
MLKNLIVLPDGTELYSGQGTINALQTVTLTQQVNTGTELTPGSACANMLEATLITPNRGLAVAPGTELILYKVADDGTRTKVGLFTAEKTTHPSQNTYQLTAYDRVSWMDRDLTDWLGSLNEWPYTLHTFAQMVCAACNLTLGNDAIPNGDWQIQKFSAWGITGRQLMQWVGQVCGRFVRATAEGVIELAWYTPREVAWENLPIQAPANPYAKELMLAITKFGPAMESALKSAAPNLVCAYIYELAGAVNKFYHETPILKEEDETVKAGHIALIGLARRILETSIDLLGFSAPDKM